MTLRCAPLTCSSLMGAVLMSSRWAAFSVSVTRLKSDPSIFSTLEGWILVVADDVCPHAESSRLAKISATSIHRLLNCIWFAPLLELTQLAFCLRQPFD